jgi:hypothetical protein
MQDVLGVSYTFLATPSDCEKADDHGVYLDR